MVNSASFVKRLEKILEYYQLTATAFAEEIDFNRSTISHLLSGRNKPSLEFVIKLLEKFPEVEMNWLLFGKGNFPATSEIKPVTPASNQKSNSSAGKALNLFSEESKEGKKRNTENNQSSKEVAKIVIFYKDGSFNIYEN
ncbi:helix-turn-helix domain-containing protein [Aequorivita capsosiphonis]|uniref:helix-turn-helix domain-containing protein n=1 Tax=Aequorivita capsosiphonis TaxID=487317 RepID=UPI00041D2972|nr:helix-turn-helix transcriptional regulator [Aequorivita capsosiphonis]